MWTGRTENNRIVNFAGEGIAVGDLVSVQITEALPNSNAGGPAGLIRKTRRSFWREIQTGLYLLRAWVLLQICLLAESDLILEIADYSRVVTLTPEDNRRLQALCGHCDEHLQLIENVLMSVFVIAVIPSLFPVIPSLLNKPAKRWKNCIESLLLTELCHPAKCNLYFTDFFQKISSGGKNYGGC